MREYADVHIHWLPTAESGRTIPAQLRADGSNSYKPHFRVGPAGEYLGVAFVDGQPALAAPGTEGTATAALLYLETGVDYRALVPGAAFDVLEGTRVIGHGIVQRRWRASDPAASRTCGLT